MGIAKEFPSYLEDFAQSVEQAAIFGAKKEHYNSRLEIDTEALVKNLSLKSPKRVVRSPAELYKIPGETSPVHEPQVQPC